MFTFGRMIVFEGIFTASTGNNGHHSHPGEGDGDEGLCSFTFFSVVVDFESP